MRAGYTSVREMAEHMTSAEMTELLAMDWLEPDVGQRIDEGFASLKHLIYQRTRGKSERDMRAEDFMPQRGPVDRKKVADKVRAWFGTQRAIHAEIEKVKRERG